MAFVWGQQTPEKTDVFAVCRPNDADMSIAWTGAYRMNALLRTARNRHMAEGYHPANAGQHDGVGAVWTQNIQRRAAWLHRKVPSKKPAVTAR